MTFPREPRDKPAPKPAVSTPVVSALAVAAPLGVKVSFEFFPPRNEKMEHSLWTCVERLAHLDPAFFSVTYGAGGSTRQRTHDTVLRIRRETALQVAAHLTCIEATRGEIDAIAERYWLAGIRHIVALRGDAPRNFPIRAPNSLR